MVWLLSRSLPAVAVFSTWLLLLSLTVRCGGPPWIVFTPCSNQPAMEHICTFSFLLDEYLWVKLLSHVVPCFDFGVVDHSMLLSILSAPARQEGYHFLHPCQHLFSVSLYWKHCHYSDVKFISVRTNEMMVFCSLDCIANSHILVGEMPFKRFFNFKRLVKFSLYMWSLFI